MIVREIEAEDTYWLRQEILRPGKPIETCHFNGDHEEPSFHLGAFVEGKLASVASFYLENHPQFENQVQYRLRGMATLPEFRKKGLSASLIKTGVPIIKKNQANLLWCNARTGAEPFYHKVGFHTCSNIFDIPDIGPHVLMNLELK